MKSLDLLEGDPEFIEINVLLVYYRVIENEVDLLLSRYTKW